MELQFLWLAPADWIGEDSEVGHLWLARWLEGLLPFDWELVKQKGRRYSLASLAQKKHQSQHD